MPRYFFHVRTEHRMIWDRTGLDLPDFWWAADAEMTEALWQEAFAQYLHTGGALLITDEGGQVVLAAAS